MPLCMHDRSLLRRQAGASPFHFHVVHEGLACDVVQSSVQEVQSEKQLALSSEVAKKTWTMFQSVKAAAFLDVVCH